MKCLIIDDSPEDSEWLSSLLAQAGACETKSFEQAEPALEYIAEYQSSVVFVDYQLATTRGLVFVSSIRSRSPTSRIYIVTGHRFPGLESMCAEFGVGYFEKKELTVPALQAILGRLEA